MMEEKLPKGWKLIKSHSLYSQLRGVNYSKGDAATEEFANSVLILRGGNVQNGKIVRNNDEVFVSESLVKEIQLLRKGDVIIVSSTGSKNLIGKAAGVNENFENISFGAFLTLLRPNHKVNAKLFSYFYQTDFYRQSIRDLSGGVNINNIRKDHLAQIDFPLPPLPEQQLIAAKLDALFGYLDSLREKLDRIPGLLKNFRQQVLTQAVTGELTKEWREGKSLQRIELELIEEERKRLKFELAKDRGKKSIKYKESVEIDIGGKTKGINELYPIPDSWQWVSIDKVVWNVSDGPHFSPTYVDDISGKRFISARNIKYSGIDFSDCKYVSIDDHIKFIERGAPERGDIILTKGGTTGIACLIENDSDFSYWVHLALLKPIKKFISPKYLRDAFTSSLLYKQSQELTHGVSNQDLGLTRLIYIALPLPSLEEQEEIVKRVETLFTLADKIESQYQSLKAKIDQLPQAILAKAFRGELVEQEVKGYEVEVGELGMVAEPDFNNIIKS